MCRRCVFCTRKKGQLMTTYFHPFRRRARHYLLALPAALCLLLLLSACGSANNVQIFDNANVLNHSQVQNEASSLSDPIRIYTVAGYNGTASQFNNQAISDINTDKTIVI